MMSMYFLFGFLFLGYDLEDMMEYEFAIQDDG